MPEEARRRVSRRDWLRVGGGVVGGTALGAGADGGLATDASTSRQENAEREDFVWANGPMVSNDRIRENVFAFASRHDLAVVLVKTNVDAPDTVETLRPVLAEAASRGIDVWLNVGVLHELSAPEFVDDAEKRESHLRNLREVAELYREHVDGGRIILWQEAPVLGRWDPDGKWTAESVRNLLEYGPTVFDAQRRTITEAMPEVDVGIFVHFPYIVDSKRPETYQQLLSSLRDRGAFPDFAFVDFYRGWYEKDVGPEQANDAVRSLVTNAGDGLDGGEVFYIAQSHTINPNHTPSKAAMRFDLLTAMDAGVSGMGWYSRRKYHRTEVGFNPFVPNVSDPDEFADREGVATYTVARDRYMFAWRGALGTRPGYGPGDRFDLWLRTDDVGFHDHRLWLRTTGGDWEYVGDFGGYLDGDYPYDGDPHVSIFHALDRERFLDGDLELRIASEGEATLRNVAVRPFDPGAYVTEREAASLPASSSPAGFDLAGAAPDVELSAGEERTLTVPGTAVGSALPTGALADPDDREVVDALPSATDGDYAVLDRFDLWAVGDGAGSLADVSVGDRGASDAAAAVSRDEGAAIWYGLPRSLLDGEGIDRAEPLGDGGFDALYAMPHAGRDAFVSPGRARELVADDPAAAETFSLDSTRR